MNRFSRGWNPRALWRGCGEREPKPWKIHTQASNSTGLGRTQIQPPRGVKHRELAQRTQHRCCSAGFPAVPIRPDPSAPSSAPGDASRLPILSPLRHPVFKRCLHEPHRLLPTLRLLLQKEYLGKTNKTMHDVPAPCSPVCFEYEILK